MNYEDYYEQEPSECDEIIDKAVEKLTDIIKARAKDEIEDALKKAEQKNEIIEAREKTISEMKQTIAIKNKEIAELQKKRASIPALPYELGQRVWNAGWESKKLKCPKCGGDGRVSVEIEGESYKAECPVCRGYCCSSGKAKKEVTYYHYTPEAMIIETIAITVNKRGEMSFGYSGRNYMQNLTDVYGTWEECLAACVKLNEQSLAKAQKELNGEDK